MVKKNLQSPLRSRSLAFLCLSAGILTLWQLPSRAAMPMALQEIMPLPSLGLANNYLPIDPSEIPPEIPNISPTINPNKPVDNATEVAEAIRLELRLGERRVYVFKGDEVIANYPVAIGRSGWETPTGEFVVRDMIENPGWENFITGEIMPPGGDNPLGVRWISFWTDGVNEIGFHGTPYEEFIGQAVSHGCVRMRNQDVVALFNKVAIGTPVVVKQ